MREMGDSVEADDNCEPLASRSCALLSIPPLPLGAAFIVHSGDDSPSIVEPIPAASLSFLARVEHLTAKAAALS